MPLGYKRRGARFIRSENGLDYAIYLERSSWNSLTDRPKQLSVIIEVFSDRKLYASTSLFRLTKLKFPSYYAPFFLDNLDWPEKGRLMASFSTEQLGEIDKYLESIHWYYDSEESLVGLLEEVKVQLINVGLPTFSFVNDNGVKEIKSFDLSLEMKRKSNQLYLMQLNSISRFPME